jgi:hypothetical protein
MPFTTSQNQNKIHVIGHNILEISASAFKGFGERIIFGELEA